MNSFVFPPAPQAAIEITRDGRLYPVARIFCVGRNYAEHAREMGHAVDREAPFYFTKPASAIAPSGSVIPYPPGTTNYHYEMEFVIALGSLAFRVSAEQATHAIFGYAAGLDMTRRDLQLAAREKGRPWDLGKAFEQSAILGPVTRVEHFGAVKDQRLWLTVNGTVRQDARLSDLVWSVPALISHLSQFYHLGPGDLIFTGTPAGVGPIKTGDRLIGGIDGLTPVEIEIG